MLFRESYYSALAAHKSMVARPKQKWIETHPLENDPEESARHSKTLNKSATIKGAALQTTAHSTPLQSRVPQQIRKLINIEAALLRN